MINCKFYRPDELLGALYAVSFYQLREVPDDLSRITAPACTAEILRYT
jgi:hypothetical protein